MFNRILFNVVFFIVLFFILSIFGAILYLNFTVWTTPPEEIGKTLDQVFGPLLQNLK